MDTSKDNQNNKHENQGQIAGMTIFDSHAHFVFVHKKTEKIVTALYLVSNFIKDNEPIKWSIRNKALELLELATLLDFVSTDEKRQVLRDHRSVATEIISLSDIARYAGLFSEMNHEIIKKEFEALLQTIDEGQKKQESSIFSPDFFDTKNFIEKQPEVSFTTPKIQKDKIEKIQERKIINKTSDFHRDIKDSDRKGLIISMLKKKEGLGIKDFTQVIAGVSEKTIQRELLSLVAEGTIKKEGDRRWSRYFLPN